MGTKLKLNSKGIPQLKKVFLQRIPYKEGMLESCDYLSLERDT
jgi:hypothetical protein